MLTWSLYSVCLGMAVAMVICETGYDVRVGS